MSTPIIFNGSIPRQYDDYLTPFLFDGFAEDLAGRMVIKQNSKVLELAAGTGSVTKQLIRHLPSSTEVMATDLQPDMLAIAKKNIMAPNLQWAMVDMTAIPFEENRFDTVVCQFGLMLVPEKLKALQEIYRVLKPGGQLLFNVWGNIADNPVWRIGGEMVESFLGTNPILQDPGPFSLDAEKAVGLLQEAGFINTKAINSKQTGQIATAEMAAAGFIGGLPVFLALNKKDPALIPQVIKGLEIAFAQQLGAGPVQSPLHALVFEAYKK